MSSTWRTTSWIADPDAGPRRPSFDAAVEAYAERLKALGAADDERTLDEAVRAVEAADRTQTRRQMVLGEAWVDRCPRRFAEVDFDQLDQPPEVVEPLLAWLQMARVGTGSNLVLIGPVGPGKSHTAMAVARELHFFGHLVRFTPAPEMLEALRPDGGGSMEEWSELDVLVLDDLGTEWPTEWTAYQLNRVLNLRWLERHPTIVTTNLEPSALTKLYGDRFRSRLADGAVVLLVGGDDRRAGPWAP